jgi:hypothetical protein
LIVQWALARILQVLADTLQRPSSFCIGAFPLEHGVPDHCSKPLQSLNLNNYVSLPFAWIPKKEVGKSQL